MGENLLSIGSSTLMYQALSCLPKNTTITARILLVLAYGCVHECSDDQTTHCNAQVGHCNM